MVGYELSPVLWRKVKAGLSAGRVQPVSVRLIVEKEREIKNFISKSSYKLIGVFENEPVSYTHLTLPTIYSV